MARKHRDKIIKWRMSKRTLHQSCHWRHALWLSACVYFAQWSRLTSREGRWGGSGVCYGLLVVDLSFFCLFVSGNETLIVALPWRWIKSSRLMMLNASQWHECHSARVKEKQIQKNPPKHCIYIHRTSQTCGMCLFAGRNHHSANHISVFRGKTNVSSVHVSLSCVLANDSSGRTSCLYKRSWVKSSSSRFGHTVINNHESAVMDGRREIGKTAQIVSRADKVIPGRW